MNKDKFGLILIITILIYGLLYNSLYAALSIKIDNLMEEAKELIVSGKFEEGRTKINQAIGLAPEEPYPYFMLGNSYYAQKKYTEAIKYFEIAIAKDNQYGQAYYNLGRAYCHKNDKINGMKYLHMAKELFAVQNLPEKYEKSLKLLIEISVEGSNSYQKELDDFYSKGLPPTPTPTITPTLTPTLIPTVTPTPTLTPTATPVPTPVGVALTEVNTFHGLRKIAYIPDPSIMVTIDDRPFEGIIIKEEEFLYTEALHLFYNINYEAYYDPIEGNVIVEGEAIPKEFFRVDNDKNLYISLSDFCNYKQFTFTSNDVYSGIEIKIYTKYQKTGDTDFLYFILEEVKNSNITQERPVIYVNGVTDGGTFHIFDSYFRLNLADGKEYYLYMESKSVSSGNDYIDKYKLVEFIRQELIPVSGTAKSALVDGYTYRNFTITFYDPTRGTVRIMVLYKVYEGQWWVHQYNGGPSSEPTAKPPNWYFNDPVQYGPDPYYN